MHEHLVQSRQSRAAQLLTMTSLFSSLMEMRKPKYRKTNSGSELKNSIPFSKIRFATSVALLQWYSISARGHSRQCETQKLEPKYAPAASKTSHGVQRSFRALPNIVRDGFKPSARRAKRIYDTHAIPYSVRRSVSSLFFRRFSSDFSENDELCDSGCTLSPGSVCCECEISDENDEVAELILFSTASRSALSTSKNFSNVACTSALFLATSCASA